jgi:hypothetical protein
VVSHCFVRNENSKIDFHVCGVVQYGNEEFLSGRKDLGENVCGSRRRIIDPHHTFSVGSTKTHRRRVRSMDPIKRSEMAQHGDDVDE